MIFFKHSVDSDWADFMVLKWITNHLGVECSEYINLLNVRYGKSEEEKKKIKRREDRNMKTFSIIFWRKPMFYILIIHSKPIIILEHIDVTVAKQLKGKNERRHSEKTILVNEN